MNATHPLAELERAASVLAAAATPSEVFRRLLETAALGAPKAAVLLLRQGQIKGWGCTGYTAAASQRLRDLVAPADSGWLGQLISTDQRGMIGRGAEHDDPDFGQSASETIGAPLRVGGRTVALLIAQRQGDGGTWEPEFLAVLITIAEIRLELDLARRKIKRLQEGKPSASRAEGGSTPAVAAGGATTSESVGLAPAPVPALGEERSISGQDPARRYARLIATDIRLYNEEAVMMGRRNRDLGERLGDHLNRGRETFLRRYPDLGREGLRILHEAFVQVLAAGDDALLPAPDPD